MKSIILGATVAVALATAAIAKTDSDDAVKAELVKLEEGSWTAWKARDGKYFETFLSEDHIEIHPPGLADKAAVVGGVSSPACVVESFSLGEMKFTRVSKDVALLVYRAEQKTKCGGNDVPSPVWATSLYAKRGGKWVNVLYGHTPAQ